MIITPPSSCHFFSNTHLACVERGLTSSCTCKQPSSFNICTINTYLSIYMAAAPDSWIIVLCPIMQYPAQKKKLRLCLKKISHHKNTFSLSFLFSHLLNSFCQLSTVFNGHTTKHVFILVTLCDSSV